MRDDVELQAYVNEVSLDGTGKNGGIGRVSLVDINGSDSANATVYDT